MKLKLTASEFTALYNILQAMVNMPPDREDFIDRLLHTVIAEIYIKFHQQTALSKPKYVVNLSAAQAITFYIQLCDYCVDPSSFEDNLVRQITNSIHQKFSSL